MAGNTLPQQYDRDTKILRLAREIAVDHDDLETILERHQIEPKDWEDIRRDPRFLQILESEVAAWNSALNTHERTKLKAAALIEEWLPEANARLHDSKENLPAKVELGKLLARIAGMGLNGVGVEGGGAEKFSVTINLGGDAQLKFTKDLPLQAIEAQPVED